MKILHPNGAPTDGEFEDYVAYAIECRRRVKEQMNKRKPDDEFALINLSYFNADGGEIVVFCPESKDALATQQPARRRLGGLGAKAGATQDLPTPLDPPGVKPTPIAPEAPSAQSSEPAATVGPKEQHYTITYGAIGYSYESILGPYLEGAKAVVIEDPYIRLPHQITNVVRVCETLLKPGTVKQILLITGYDHETQLADITDKLEDLKQSLLELDVVLEVKLNPNLHDREIRIDNGWTIKIGRGLDFYQKPESWYGVGATDLSLRKCLETKVDIFRV